MTGVQLDQSILRARSLIDGYNVIGCEALNIGAKDFTGGLDFLLGLKESANFPFVSANIIHKETRELVFEPYAIAEKNNFRFGIVGLTTMLPKDVEDLELLDPVEEGNKILALLEKKTDYQIVLFNGSFKEATEARNALLAADFMFLSGDTRTPRRRGENPTSGPRLYPLGRQGKSLAVFHLNVEDIELSLTDVTNLKVKENFMSRTLENLGRKDPSKGLEEIYQDNPRMLGRVRQYRDELGNVQLLLAKEKNTIRFDFVSMNRRVEDDPPLLSMVTETLSACASLADAGKKRGSVSKTSL